MFRFSRYILIFLLAFIVGLRFTSIPLKDEGEPLIQIQIPQWQESIEQNERDASDEPYVLPQDNCGKWTDDVDYRPILKKWLRGKKLKSIAYCSKSAIEATAFNPSNVFPTEIDLNGDGRKELAIKSGCSPTGNCTMVIYERVGKKTRKFFTDTHGVQMFGVHSTKYFGYFDIWTTMHGSWNSGDRIVYRYNGRKYEPVSCSHYEYKVESYDTEANIRPTLTPVRCSSMVVDY